MQPSTAAAPSYGSADVDEMTPSFSQLEYSVFELIERTGQGACARCSVVGVGDDLEEVVAQSGLGMFLCFGEIVTKSLNLGFHCRQRDVSETESIGIHGRQRVLDLRPGGQVIAVQVGMPVAGARDALDDLAILNEHLQHLDSHAGLFRRCRQGQVFRIVFRVDLPCSHGFNRRGSLVPAPWLLPIILRQGRLGTMMLRARYCGSWEVPLSEFGGGRAAGSGLNGGRVKSSLPGLELTIGNSTMSRAR